MRSKDLYALVIKIVAIFFLARAISMVGSAIPYVTSSTIYTQEEMLGVMYVASLISILVIVVLYLGFALVLIFRSRPIAAWLSRGEPDEFRLGCGVTELRAVAFLAIGSYLVVVGIAGLSGIVVRIVAELGSGMRIQSYYWSSLVTSGLKFILGLGLIGCRHVSEWAKAVGQWLRQTRRE